MRCGFISIGFIFVLVSTAQGITIHVPAGQPTIQAGIDAAVDGDTVLVAPGTYVENIDFKGKVIEVRSSDGADVTIIDGYQYGSVVIFSSGEGTDSVLDGFTVTNGNSFYYAGGIFCYDSSPTITNNIISQNTAVKGGGI